MNCFLSIRYNIAIVLVLTSFSCGVFAQVNSPARYEIDAKRLEMTHSSNDYSSPEMMLRSREFIRLDPSYYVGYMLEGFFRYDRAGDVKGYQLALVPIKKALKLFEKDYSSLLRGAFVSSETFESSRDRLLDYVFLTDRLMDCYSNIERPDSVIFLLNHYKSWNFQFDMLGADNYIAWTYHRNRFYTSDKFAFLFNTVEKNEQAALRYLKQNLAEIEAKAFRNEQIMSYRAILGAKMSVYHYLAILYSYMHKPDSARMYFEFMEPYNIFPYNNYAIFCFVNGAFSESYDYFGYAMRVDAYDKYRLRESIYYQSMLDALAGKPENSVRKISQYIARTGVRPGWGWYNIALGRAMLYNGQVDSSLICVNKASRFNDVHIGTTWGKSHYAFSHSILKLMNLEYRAAAMRFENKYYWTVPTKLRKMAELKLEQYATRISLFNQLSSNPEREEVYYRLFASEATVLFDEIYCMIKDYGRKYFIRKFTEAASNDERPEIRKYFSLLAAKLQIEKGEKSKALQCLSELKSSAKVEKDYERLFTARLYEALALCSTGSERANYVNQFYAAFPQLVPFSEVTMKFRLEVKGDDSPIAKQAVEALKSLDIEFTGDNRSESPKVLLQFFSKGTINAVTYSVESSWGTVIVEATTLNYSDPEELGKNLGYAIFKVGTKKHDEDYYF
ncbi:MAG: hypothetical protein LBC98_05400 [Prevotellaceae bacterium]|jgi:hypothetical protein|nr:hypothetical protein [Prevotellaceae bacterium]